MTYDGTISNGQIVLENAPPLPEGARVRIEINQLLLNDEWLRRLRSAASDCGVSLPNDSLSSEGL